MPFKSEAQRKYLWANEPEIARDWTDTYGSGIHKAKGGRIGFAKGSWSPGVAAEERESRQEAREAMRGPIGRSTLTPTVDQGHTDEGWQTYAPSALKKPLPPSIPTGERINTWLNQKMPKLRHQYNINRRNKHLQGLSQVDIDKLIAQGLMIAGEEDDYFEPRWAGDISTMESLRQLQDLTGYTGGLDNTNDRSGGGQPYIYSPTGIASASVAPVEEEEIVVADSGLGSGHFRVPEQYRLAEGGRIGYLAGNMVGAEMEGAEMEGAMIQSQEVIKELYEALIAQGLSPQAAIEKIKEIIAGSQEQEPQSPMMAEEFPGQEFGRAPAAFGGIMDTYTGRRKYFLGSVGNILKKAVGKVKKLASSKLGKAALMYAAGTYLGGMEAFGGEGLGWKKFGARLLDPMSTKGGISNVGRTAMNLFSSPIQDTVKKKAGEELTKAAVPWYKNPGVMIPIAMGGAGLYTDKQPLGSLDDTQGEWNKKKEDFDRYLASLDTEDSYRVPSQYTLAQGGRIGYLAGGPLVKKGIDALRKFKRPIFSFDDEAKMIMDLTETGKYTEKELMTLEGDQLVEIYVREGFSPPKAIPQVDETIEMKKIIPEIEKAQGGRIGRQEGGLLDLGGMEKDYRNDGGFVPLGGEEKADDVPARLSRNEFVFTADAVRAAGGGDIDKGAGIMENVMKNLEAGGQVSEESQGLGGAQEMFDVSERLSEVI